MSTIRVIRETHETPRSIARRLRIAGGVNRFGEANYRAVWGWNRLTWIGGKWEDRDSEGSLIREVVCYRQEPKYTPFDRWHIERWMPPEHYGSPLFWYNTEKENELGPYPHRGEYELSFTLETPQGGFVQLTPTIAERVALLIEEGRRATSIKRREAIDGRIAKEERDYDSFADAVLTDAGSAFHGVPFVNVA